MTMEVRKREESSCNCGALRKASRRMSRIYDEALAPAGLGSSQHAILAESARWTGKSPSRWELADALVMDRTTLTRNLGPLQRDGYVLLSSSETDRRSKLVALTPAGKAKLAEARVLWRKAQKEFERAFGADEARLLRSQLLAIATSSTFEPGSTDQTLKGQR
jgi:DNA-binding MarR family transcriptional regulator